MLDAETACTCETDSCKENTYLFLGRKKDGANKMPRMRKRDI